jgi:hypothetical protein
MIGSPAPQSPPLRLPRAAPRQAVRLSAEAVARQLRAPAPRSCVPPAQFQAEGTCDYADDRQFARHDHAVQPEARGPAS